MSEIFITLVCIALILERGYREYLLYKERLDYKRLEKVKEGSDYRVIFPDNEIAPAPVPDNTVALEDITPDMMRKDE